MRNQSRQRFFVDCSVQGTLIYRVLLYWLLFVSGIFILLTSFPLVVSCFIQSPGAPTASQIILQTWRVFWPALFASALLLPVLVLDVIRVSNRFAGPAYRLHSALRDLADGVSTEPIKFRDRDFWSGMADEFNRVAAQIAKQKSATSTTAESPKPTQTSRAANSVTEENQIAM